MGHAYDIETACEASPRGLTAEMPVVMLGTQNFSAQVTNTT